ncbi:MAG: LuxR C-terminal-related transcriptional regulator [Actinomycetota bacterium]|nr:LuxR C-terminal-related transcriptional regulator [Actinomycetota bacterium]
MVGPLLESKYRVPSGRVGDVARPRLTERLEATSRAAVTLVSAPAGFGKTTILANWLAAAPVNGPPVAWVSLDPRDNDPTSFWTYVVTALQSAVPAVGVAALGLLHTPQPAPAAVISALLADLDRLPTDLLLVLDDYHLIEASQIHDDMAFLVEHQPPRLHLVIATRADPALALAGLRARGQLVEVRAADLRFTAEESATYLNGPMGLALTEGDLATLDGRTEGWIAALQLAALSMQGRDDVSAFIAGFAGDDRYIVDYLAEEVLTRQSAEVRDFLLETSILDRLSGPLCDAVTGRSGGRARLVALERANLFLVPLDDRRQWWRYHHLFADVLQAHLVEERGDAGPELHRRASIWFERHGDTSQAIRHAMAARDFDRAAELMELAIPAMARERREAEAHGWVLSLPDEVVAVRPVLGVAFVGALTLVSDFGTVAERLDDVERSLRVAASDPWPDQPPPGLVVVDRRGYQKLPGTIQMYRAALALASGDLSGTVNHAQQALALAAPDDDLTRASAGALGGLAAWTEGDLDAAHAAYTATVTGLHKAGFVADVLGCSITLGDIRVTQGRLGDALRTYEGALDLTAPQPGTPRLRGAADMHVGVAGVLLERDDRVGAAEHLAASQRLGDYNGLPQHPYRSRLAMARLLEAEGDLDGALVLINEADRVYAGDYSPNVRPVPALRARLQVRRGELGSATRWASERGLTVDDDLSYLREFEHITLARLLLAQYAGGHGAQRDSALREATDLLQRVLAAAEAGGRYGTVIELLILLSLAHQQRRELPGALTALQRAVALSEHEGYLRVFADEGPPLAWLLNALTKQGGSTAYVRRLIAASSGTPHRAATSHALVAPLSDRELDVLRLLATDLGGPDIARQLSVSLNTMRTHTKNIYAKLGVTSRRAAVRQAQQLDLLPGQHQPPGHHN